MNPALRGSDAHVFVDSLDDPRLDPADAHHLTRVLRIRPRDAVTVSDGAGRWALGTVEGGVVTLTGPVVEERLPAFTRGIVTAVPKGDRPELIVQKLTELGLDRIAFVETERSVVRWDDRRRSTQLERLRRVAREAAMQSRRVRLPTVDVVSWDDVVGEDGLALAEPGAERLDPLDPTVRTVVVGPEGGFTARELTACARHVALSDQVLRVETAAIAAGVLLMLGARGADS